MTDTVEGRAPFFLPFRFSSRRFLAAFAPLHPLVCSTIPRSQQRPEVAQGVVDDQPWQAGEGGGGAAQGAEGGPGAAAHRAASSDDLTVAQLQQTRSELLSAIAAADAQAVAQLAPVVALANQVIAALAAGVANNAVPVPPARQQQRPAPQQQVCEGW